MANITVNHSQLETTASVVETYIKSHKTKMKNIEQAVSALSISWQGSDYDQLKVECGQLSDSGSTSDNMIKTLGNYAEFLRFAAGKYKSAQMNAVNRANNLPRY